MEINYQLLYRNMAVCPDHGWAGYLHDRSAWDKVILHLEKKIFGSQTKVLGQ